VSEDKSVRSVQGLLRAFLTFPACRPSPALRLSPLTSPPTSQQGGQGLWKSEPPPDQPCGRATAGVHTATRAWLRGNDQLQEPVQHQDWQAFHQDPRDGKVRERWVCVPGGLHKDKYVLQDRSIWEI
jgi:hypothetical protein